MKASVKKRLLRLFVLIGLLAFSVLGGVIGNLIFAPENPLYYDQETDEYVGGQYVVETLHLDNSRIFDAMQSKAVTLRTHYPLYDEALTRKVSDFLELYTPSAQNETAVLIKMKSEVEELLDTIYRYIRGFNGKELTNEDKQHYLAVYRLREIDREITRQLLDAEIEEKTYFQKPALVKDGTGYWTLSIQKPESEHLTRYYILIQESNFIREIIERVNELFSFSVVHTLTFLEGGKTYPPIYDRETKNINICYEEFEFIENIFRKDLKSRSEINRLIIDVVGMVCLREFGHAFLDIFDVPYSGKMENAVDQLAVILVAEIFDFNWDTVQNKVMAYAKALYRIHELIESNEDTTIPALLDLNITRAEIENQSILLLNDSYDNSFLLGKQRFYAILNMLVGYQADAFSPYTRRNEYDVYEILPMMLFENPRTYLRASNYWYNTLSPYFRYPEREG